MTPVVKVELLERARQGDSDAAQAVLREVGPHVASLVRRLGARHEREDLVQAALTHVLEVLPRFDPRGSAQLTTWAFTVTHRFLLMQHRKRTVTLVPLEGGLAARERSRCPDERASDRQLSEQLERALERLPEEQRRVFVLTQLYELSLEEVASGEQVPVGTVKSRLHRARAALVVSMRETLAPEGGLRAAP